MSFRVVVLAAGVLLAANPVTMAQTIAGAGTISCGEWLRFRSFEDQSGHEGDRAKLFQLQAWVDGFVSGVNFARGGNPDILLSQPSFSALYAVVDNYCRTKPLDWVSSAAIALANELQARAK